MVRGRRSVGLCLQLQTGFQGITTRPSYSMSTKTAAAQAPISDPNVLAVRLSYTCLPCCALMPNSWTTGFFSFSIHAATPAAYVGSMQPKNAAQCSKAGHANPCRHGWHCHAHTDRTHLAASRQGCIACQLHMYTGFDQNQALHAFTGVYFASHSLATTRWGCPTCARSHQHTHT